MLSFILERISLRTIGAILLLRVSQIRIWIHMTKEVVNCGDVVNLGKTVELIWTWMHRIFLTNTTMHTT